MPTCWLPMHVPSVYSPSFLIYPREGNRLLKKTFCFTSSFLVSLSPITYGETLPF